MTLAKACLGTPTCPVEVSGDKNHRFVGHCSSDRQQEAKRNAAKFRTRYGNEEIRLTILGNAARRKRALVLNSSSAQSSQCCVIAGTKIDVTSESGSKVLLLQGVQQRQNLATWK